MSNPFQVLSPSLKNVRNPFEKLALSPMGDVSTLDSDMAVESNVEEDPEDEALDPNRTLKMFSISQPTTQILKDTPNTREGSDDDGLDEELEHLQEDLDITNLSSFGNGDMSSLNTKRPRLHEALEISANPKKSEVAQELQAPGTSSNPSKKLGTEYKISSRVPLDWTLKNSCSISSPDTLSWCDQGSTVDEIEALQVFVSNPQSQIINASYSKPDQSLSASARTRLLSTMYHWIYPANSPTIPQAQSISRLLKNAGNMSSSEKNSITDLFSRSAEWKQTFRAIYQACRNGTCPYFYYVGSTWTILFQHGNVSISGKIEAILTNSTPGLRKVLSEEDIAFERLPHISRKTTVNNFSAKHDLTDIDDNDSELAHEGDTARAPLLQAGDQDLSDTLLFKGQGDVHGLFSYLLNLKTSYEDGFLYQSPSLIADVPFLHASLKKAQVTND
ncbi:hypothetical protein BGZ58_008787 [Dissophora ornata]|nr:hypothetical protein BGZ58_008787 [Dissophora ornata]